MKLRQIKINNFRCYKEEIVVDVTDITTIVGRNDAGKSTLMEAMDIFFNGGVPDKSDASKGGPADIEIVCTFDDLPEAIVLDDSVATTFEAEYLLNKDGYLELHKIFNGSLATPKLTEWYATAMHPVSAGLADLLMLNNKELKDRAKELDVDLQGIADKKINAELRAAIRAKVGVGKLQNTKISFLKGGAENVGKGVLAEIPAFALFKSDRASTDQDPEAQDPLKVAIKEALKKKEAELNLLATFVSEEVKKIADLTLAKLREMDPALATTLTPHFSPPNWASLFKASITSDNEIPINKRGSGVRRLILLNFFRAKSQQQNLENKKSKTIYAIEEPETSQHPRNQRLLLSALQELSNQDQVMITSHTPMLVRALPAVGLRFISRDELTGKREILNGGTDESNQIIANSLGVLPDHNVRIFIGVEGKTDIPFLKNIARVFIESGDVDVPDIEKMELDGELIFLPLGGSGLAEWTNRLAKLHRPEFHLYDRDTEPPAQSKYQKYIDKINLRPKCRAYSTTRREIENYLHKIAIDAAITDAGYQTVFPAEVSATMDVPIELVTILNKVASQGDQWKGTRAKEFLCNVAARKMTLELIDIVDPLGEMRGWFMEIKEMHRLAIE